MSASHASSHGSSDNSSRRYALRVTWTGNTGRGTSDYRAYQRAHDISVPGKPTLAASSDAAFRGDASRYNPEELLVASLSSCHMLWYLHLAADAGLVVTGYADDATGAMREESSGRGAFTEVLLRPRVTVRPGADVHLATELHDRAHAMCFIANSVNFPVRCEPAFILDEDSTATGYATSSQIP